MENKPTNTIVEYAIRFEAQPLLEKVFQKLHVLIVSMFFIGNLRTENYRHINFQL